LKKSYVIPAIFAGIFALAFVARQLSLDENIETKTLAIQNQANVIQALKKIDDARTYNMNRVISVIDRYNRSMPVELKYKIASEISDASMRYNNLDVDLICATITHESAFTWNSKIVSPVGAMGLMQIMPATGKFLAGIEDVSWTSAQDVLFDPVLNIRLGTRYLSSLIETYEVDGGLAAYNGGGKRAKMWLTQNRKKGVLYKETQAYVPAVLTLYNEFRMN